MSVSLVCPITYLENHMAKLHLIFCACCPWKWLGRFLGSIVVYTLSFVADAMFSYSEPGGTLLSQQHHPMQHHTCHNASAAWYW